VSGDVFGDLLAASRAARRARARRVFRSSSMPLPPPVEREQAHGARSPGVRDRRSQQRAEPTFDSLIRARLGR
jgi:hypothetical protein